MHDPPPGLDAFRRLVADRVRDEREHAGLSQEQLAHAAGLGVRTVINLESGRHGWSDRSLFLVARALGVTFAQLVTEADDGPGT